MKGKYGWSDCILLIVWQRWYSLENIKWEIHFLKPKSEMYFIKLNTEYEINEIIWDK